MINIIVYRSLKLTVVIVVDRLLTKAEEFYLFEQQ